MNAKVGSPGNPSYLHPCKDSAGRLIEACNYDRKKRIV
jgi:hypothetical protein